MTDDLKNLNIPLEIAYSYPNDQSGGTPFFQKYQNSSHFGLKNTKHNTKRIPVNNVQLYSHLNNLDEEHFVSSTHQQNYPTGMSSRADQHGNNAAKRQLPHPPPILNVAKMRGMNYVFCIFCHMLKSNN